MILRNRFSCDTVKTNYFSDIVTISMPNTMIATNFHTPRSAGYAALIELHELEVIPNWHKSLVAPSGPHRIDATGPFVVETYPPAYWPGDTLGDHLEFALKYDGTNLAILAKIFEAVDAADLVAYVQSKPTGKYARRLWYLYEFLVGRRLPIEDLGTGNYVDLLDQKQYYTSNKSEQVRRQRIKDNLFGDRRFCPMVRRTEKLRNFEAADLTLRCQQIVSSYPADLIRRALSYLYTKETKSSFEIESITPDASRTERFVALLQLAEHEDFVEKNHLVELQNRVVDPRFAEEDYRKVQNYVGEALPWRPERVHLACPKPEDLPGLMDGLISTHRRMADGGAHAVVHAAAIGYGFVFLHPFEDGNGRIHRFLIHNIFARRGFTPEGIMFPVSAIMLKHSSAYDDSLEAFSKPLMLVVEYTLDEEGQMTVRNDTAIWYRYMDMTPQVEALFSFAEMTIETELVDELDFLANYDRTKTAIQNIVDMPDRQIDLFIRLCLQNNVRLSQRKRASQFHFLTDGEIARMEEAIRDSYGERATEYG